MKSFLRTLLILAVIALVLIQFFRPVKNIGEAEGEKSLVVLHKAPDAVRDSLREACYDCHSNNTRYPWYAEVQPVAWWMASHIKDGRRKFNLSEFGRYEPKKAAHKLEELINEVKEGEMAPGYYKALHAKARFNFEQSAELTAWAAGIQKQIAATVTEKPDTH